MAIAFISGAVRAFDRPSRMALLPHMVPKVDIPNAVAIGGTIWQLCKLARAGGGGILIYLFGVAVTYDFVSRRHSARSFCGFSSASLHAAHRGELRAACCSR